MTSSKKFVASGSVLFISSLVVNAGNYLINLILGRWIGPEAFSEVSLLVTLMLMTSFIALAFQLTAAKFVALNHTHNSSQKLYNWLNKSAIRSGLILTVLLLASSYFLKNFLHFSSIAPFAVLGIGLPIYFILSINRGFLQGKLAYTKLAITYQTEMFVRMIVTFFLVYLGFEVLGVAVGLSVSLLAAWYISRFKSDISDISDEALDTQKIINSLLIILVYECSQILINNSDIVLVKHYFSPTDAGLYAALALIGRIVYFGTWTVVTLLFPVVIKLEKEGKNHLPYFVGGLAAVTFLASIIVVVSYFFPSLLVSILFGKSYLSIAPLLWKYALATALFAISNIFAYYHLSLDRLLPVYLTIIAGILQIALIIGYHSSINQVVLVQIYAMCTLLILMLLYQLFHKALKM